MHYASALMLPLCRRSQHVFFEYIWYSIVRSTHSISLLRRQVQRPGEDARLPAAAQDTGHFCFRCTLCMYLPKTAPLLVAHSPIPSRQFLQWRFWLFLSFHAAIDTRSRISRLRPLTVRLLFAVVKQRVRSVLEYHPCTRLSSDCIVVLNYCFKRNWTIILKTSHKSHCCKLGFARIAETLLSAAPSCSISISTFNNSYDYMVGQKRITTKAWPLPVQISMYCK